MCRKVHCSPLSRWRFSCSCYSNKQWPVYGVLQCNTEHSTSVGLLGNYNRKALLGISPIYILELPSSTAITRHLYSLQNKSTVSCKSTRHCLLSHVYPNMVYSGYSYSWQCYVQSMFYKTIFVRRASRIKSTIITRTTMYLIITFSIYSYHLTSCKILCILYNL